MSAVAPESDAGPVVGCRGAQTSTMSNRGPIVAVIDRSATPTVVRTVVDLASMLGVPIVFVVSRRRPSSVLGEPFYQRRLTAATAVARRLLEAALVEAAHSGVAAEGEILERPPRTSIIRFARARGASLIVIGSREGKLDQLGARVLRWKPKSPGVVVAEVTASVRPTRRRALHTEG